MSFVIAHENYQLAGMEIAELQFQSTCLANELQRLSCEIAHIYEQEMNDAAYMLDLDPQIAGTDAKYMANIETWTSSVFYTKYETQLALLQNKEKRIETEKAQIDTQIKAYEQLEESYKKEIETGVKQGTISP